MLKFKKVLPLIAILVLVFACPVFAVKVATVGNYNSSGRKNRAIGTYDVEIDSDGYIYHYGADRYKYEYVVTNTTIGLTQSGTVFVVKQEADTSTKDVTFTLPSAAVGAEFTFISADNENIFVDPAIADTIYYETSNVPLDAGDSMKSPGATGDSVTLFCPLANYWAIRTINGTWTDGGTLPTN